MTNADLTLVSVEQSETLTYNGDDQSAQVTASATSVNDQPVTFTYSSTVDGTYSATVPAFKNAGEYTVYYRAAAPNHNDSTGSFTVTIDRKAATVTAD